MAAFARKRVALNDKGVAVWLVLLIIAFVFLPFMVLTIDMAYVYYTRGQLHNAADAAALAGVSGIDGMNDLVQAEARLRAQKFASKNGAAGEHVFLESDGSNTLSDTNDITVGYWNGTTYTPNDTPVNAVQVVARRTENRPNGEFGLMFGFAIGRSFMNIGAAAIASLPARAEAPLALCVDSCELPPNVILFWPSPAATTEPPDRIIAWVNLDGGKNVSADYMRDVICEKKSVVACDKTVYTNHGEAESVIKTFRCAFKDPTYDTVNKTYDGDGKVASWTVIVPIVRSTKPGAPNCPGSNQGTYEPYEIVRYAEMTITEIYPSPGGGSFCRDCPDYFPLPSGGIKDAIMISTIRCVDCPDADTELLGRTPVLVR